MRAVLIPLLVLAPIACADVWQVHPGERIEPVVRGAADGDTIIVHDGTYDETVVFYGRTVTVGSLFLLDGDTSHIAGTRITPDSLRQDTAGCFVYSYGERSSGRLVGLTLADGLGTIWGSDPRAPTGGAVFVRSAGVTIERCRFENSMASYGGGLAVCGERHTHSASAYLRECSFVGCDAPLWGGGIYANYCSLQVEGCCFEDDSAPGGGGGIIVMESQAEITRCTFRRCVGVTGGLLYLGCLGEISHCVFDSNSSILDCYGPCDLSVNACAAPICGCLFRHNAMPCPSIGLTGQEPDRPFAFYGNVVEGVVAREITGTIYLWGDGEGELAYNIFRDNVNMYTGVIMANGDNDLQRIHHNVFEHNSTIQPSHGSAIYFQEDATPQVDSNIIAGNAGIAVGCEYDTVARSCQLNWWGDSTGPYHPLRNPGGRGDTLAQDSILFEPWLRQPPDTSLPSSVGRSAPRTFATTWQIAAVFPNPFNATIRIVLAGFAGEDFRITLHNILGQEVASIHCGSMIGGELFYTAPPSLSSGVYFVRATSRSGSQTRKVVLLR